MNDYPVGNAHMYSSAGARSPCILNTLVRTLFLDLEGYKGHLGLFFFNTSKNVSP